MNSSIAKKWVAALRSGDFVQQQNGLANADRSAHCCLGVLCELAILDGVELDMVAESVLNFTAFDRELYTLPLAVQDWAELATSTGELVRSRGGDIERLVDLNDALGLNFRTIADVIEKHTGQM